MILLNYDYISVPSKTGDIENDVKCLLRCNNKTDTLQHIVNVSQVNYDIAKRFGLDKNKCIISGLLHDISAIIKPEDMLKYAEDNSFEICEAEYKFPFLLHQRISRIIANDYFGITDNDILDAIECHTTLKATPGKYEMALFVADKLAWDQFETPPFYNDVMLALNDSFEKACFEYMRFMNDNGKVLCPHNNWTLGYKWLKKTVLPKAIESRCGLLCSECSFRESYNCGGCVETNGHPFHGECPVAKCCQDKGFMHCGECPDIPKNCGESDCKKKDENGFTLCDTCDKTTCGKLHAYSYTDPDHGDNPPGARVEQCKKWAKENEDNDKNNTSN